MCGTYGKIEAVLLFRQQYFVLPSKVRLRFFQNHFCLHLVENANKVHLKSAYKTRPPLRQRANKQSSYSYLTQ